MSRRTELILVTPEMAERWLASKAANRHLNENLALEYALVMEGGGWEETHQGLAFDDKGRLVDGQHRLQAVTLSRKAQKFLVTRGLTRDEVLAIDRGRVRDAADSLTIFRGQRVDKHTVAVANRVIHISSFYAAKVGRTPGATWRVSTDALDEFLRKHPAAMIRACELKNSHKRSTGISSALVGSLLFRAYYHMPDARLSQLIDVLATGHYDDKERDDAGLRLRDHVLAQTDGWRGNSLMDHFRMERAIKAFWKGERLARVFPATEEVFPLPEEKGTTSIPATLKRLEAARAVQAGIGLATRALRRATKGDSL